MPRSEAQKRADKKYRDSHTDNDKAPIILYFKRDQREQINEYCKQFGGTATHIKNLLRQDMLAHGVQPLKTPNQQKSDEN